MSAEATSKFREIRKLIRAAGNEIHANSAYLAHMTRLTYDYADGDDSARGSTAATEVMSKLMAAMDAVAVAGQQVREAGDELSRARNAAAESDKIRQEQARRLGAR